MRSSRGSSSAPNDQAPRRSRNGLRIRRTGRPRRITKSISPRATVRDKIVSRTTCSSCRLPVFGATASTSSEIAPRISEFTNPHRSLRIVATSEVRLKGHPESPLWSPRWEEVRDLVAKDRRPETLAAYAFAFDSPYVKAHADLREFALPSFPKGRPLLEAMVDLTKRIHTQFKHDPTATQISTPLAEVLLFCGAGSAKIFASRSVVFARWGSPGATSAAICSTLPPPGKPRLVG